MDAVGTDQDVALRGASIGEARADRGRRLLDGGQARAEAQRDAGRGRRLADHLVQPGSPHDDASSLAVAGGAVRHLAEGAPASAEHHHARRPVGIGQQALPQPELCEHREAVGRDVEEEPAGGVGRVGGFEDLDVPPGPGEDQGGGRARDAGADDECSGHERETFASVEEVGESRI